MAYVGVSPEAVYHLPLALKIDGYSPYFICSRIPVFRNWDTE